MHRVEYALIKPVRREVTVYCTDTSGVSEQKRVPLVNLAAFILNSVQRPEANRRHLRVERIDWSGSNV